MMPNNIQPFTNDRGLSLIEVMVALAVSSILLLGVATVYTASKRSYQTNDELAGLQENARFALHTLARNVRMAGYTGCRKLDSTGLVNNIDDPDDAGQPHPLYNIDIGTVAVGHRDTGAWTPALPITPINIVAGTNAISIRRATECSQKLTTDMAVLTDPVTVSNVVNCNYAVNQPVIVTNCTKSDIFMITSVTANGGDFDLGHDLSANWQDTLSESYTTGSKAFVLSLFTTLYYIGDNGAGTSLYEITNGAAPTELIPNVEDMVIRYGLNTDSSADNSIDTRRFADGIAANEWSQVVNVYMRLLLVSDEVGTAPKIYTFDGVTFDGTGGNPLPADNRYRKEFVTTINIRNRTIRDRPPANAAAVAP